MQATLWGYKPHKDGGGTVTYMLDEYQFREFISTIPDLLTVWALARLKDDESK